MDHDHDGGELEMNLTILCMQHVFQGGVFLLILISNARGFPRVVLSQTG